LEAQVSPPGDGLPLPLPLPLFSFEKKENL
jgi:hypothetical protein